MEVRKRIKKVSIPRKHVKGRINKTGKRKWNTNWGGRMVQMGNHGDGKG